MTWHRGLLAVGWIDPHGMASAFPKKLAAVFPQGLDEIDGLHEAISPAGTCSTRLLALKCR